MGAVHPRHAPLPVWLLVSVGKRGALSVPLFLFLRRVHRAPPVSSPPMGWTGFVPSGPARPYWAKVRGPVGPCRPDRHRGPGLGRDWLPTKPRYRCATNPAPPPSPTPRSGAGFPRGRWGDYRLRGAALD